MSFGPAFSRPHSERTALSCSAVFHLRSLALGGPCCQSCDHDPFILFLSSLLLTSKSSSSIKSSTRCETLLLFSRELLNSEGVHPEDRGDHGKEERRKKSATSRKEGLKNDRDVNDDDGDGDDDDGGVGDQGQTFL